MTDFKSKLFQKYGINATHALWVPTIDNWMAVELYRYMHNGQLPPPDDLSLGYVLEFLDKCDKEKGFMRNLMATRRDAGSLYLTARRMVYRFWEYAPGGPKDPQKGGKHD